jgi:hypothetical protein
MFHVEKFHSRMESVNGEWFFDGEPITDGQAAYLRYHYNKLVEDLKKPWHTRDDRYDQTGRLNYHWED